MRGEYCIAGGSILSALAVILLVFVNIGQLSTGAVVKGLYLAEINVQAYGAAYVAATGGTGAGLYDTKNDPLGSGMGLRQNYKYGLYNVCAYQKTGTGVCNSTIFGYPFEGLGQIIEDIPLKLQDDTANIVGDIGFADVTNLHNMSRAGSLLIFVAGPAALAALIFGCLKARFFFLIASVCSGLSALLLLIGASLWTGLIAKAASANSVMATATINLGMMVTVGPGVYLTWVSFVLMTFATAPYVISFITFRRK